jgi:Na+-transporting NADH:ubiquinone oxidoreductase subunit F
VFYQEYFEGLARQHSNFSFHLALSEPQPGDKWTGAAGFIHEVLKKQYLDLLADPGRVEYYLCGPPAMVRATAETLSRVGVPGSQISFDEF